jgi:hypothetical protein
MQEKFKLKNRIHGKRQHQQRIVVALIRKQFMWIIGNHTLLKDNKTLRWFKLLIIYLPNDKSWHTRWWATGQNAFTGSSQLSR